MNRVPPLLVHVGCATLFVLGVAFVGRPMLDAQSAPSLRTAVPEATEPIADVRIEGNSTIPASAIAKYIKTRPGRPAAQKQIREDVRALYGTRWFFSIEPRMTMSQAGPVLVFRVVERPIVKRVEFRGASKKRRKWLEAETGLKVGSPFDPSANREAVRRIERHYKEKGHYFVKVQLLRGGDREDREVIFQIDEGPKTRVTNRKFVGNEFVSAAVLRLHLQTKAAWFWVWGGKYDPSTLPNDVNALKQYYFGLGFFDAQIAADPQVSADKSSVTVVYKVIEGPRYKVRAIEIEGTEVFRPNELAADFDLEAGDFFNERKLNKDIAGVKSKYGDLGRIFATVEAVPRYLNRKGEVDLVYRIDEDRPYRIRRINVNIAGDHPHTKPQVALNYIGLAPGDLANPDKIDFARRRLSGIRVFDSKPGFAPEVNISPVTDAEMVAVADVYRGQQPRYVEGIPPDARKGSRSAEFGVRSAEFPVRPRAPVRSAVHHEDVRQHDTSHLDADLARLRREIGHTVHSEGIPAGHSDGTTRRVNRPASPEWAAPSTFGSDRPTPAHRPPFLPTSQPPPHPPLRERESREHLIPTSRYVPLDSDAIFRAQSAPADFGNGEGVMLAQGRGLNRFLPNDYRFDNDPSDGVFGDSPNAPPGSLPYEVVPRQVLPGLVDLDFTVNEAQTGRLMFGVGVNSDAGVVGTISLQEDNFDLFNPPKSFSDLGRGAWRGGGQRLRIEAVPGNVVSRYLVSWTDPFIFGSNYSLSVTGFFFNRFYRDWDEDRGGGRIAVGRQLSPEWSVTGTYRVEVIEVANPTTRLSPTLNAALGENLLQSFAFTIAHDTRDSPFLPTEGTYSRAEIEQAIGDFDFTKGELEHRRYYTIYQRADGRGRHVLTVGGEVGITSEDTQLVERFYAGGFNTFRGFDFRGVSPIESGVRVGGHFSALGSAEYKVPVTADENLALVAFTDFGTVDNSNGLSNFRVAVGGGLRITVPAMGPVPLAFDFAVPVVKENFDDERLFSFYIGITR